MCAWNFSTGSAALRRHAIRLSSIWTWVTLVNFSLYSLPECKPTRGFFDLQLFFFRLFGFLQLKEPYCSRSVLCQGFPRGGSEGMIHFSKPYQLHPSSHHHPPPSCNNATVCSPHKPRALPPPAHMWDAVLLSCSPTAGASPSRPPPPPQPPSAFPPFNLNNASFFQPHYVDCFQRTSKKEKQIEVAGDNETAGCTEAVHLAFLHLLCHVWANVYFGLRGEFFHICVRSHGLEWCHDRKAV